MKIERIDQDDGGGAFVIMKGDDRIAELTFDADGEKQVVIDHTWVDDSLRGQGIARQLLDAFVGWARDTGTKAVAQCPYARGQFDKDASIRDVLAS